MTAAADLPPGPGLLSPLMLFVYGLILLGLAALAIVKKYDEWQARVEWEAEHLYVEDMEELEKHVELILKCLHQMIDNRWAQESVEASKDGFTHKMSVTVEGATRDRELRYLLTKDSAVTDAAGEYLGKTLAATSSLFNREVLWFIEWCQKHNRKVKYQKTNAWVEPKEGWYDADLY